MTADTWAVEGNDLRAHSLRTARAAGRTLLWTLILVGPFVVGGIAGWMVTTDNRLSSLLDASIGVVPDDRRTALITGPELEAVGLDPSRLRGLTSQ